MVTLLERFVAFEVRLGNGTGGMGPKANVGPELGSKACGLADLNGDGKLDVVVGGGESFDPGQVTVFLGQGNGSFTEGVSVPVSGWIRKVALGDRRPRRWAR